MPRLFSLRGKQRELIGALGLRSAHETLFLERYLDSPVETAISNLVGTAVERHHVVEVGQFTGISAGAARTMIRHLTIRLYFEGFKWVVFTGVAGLRNAFSRLGLRPVDLAMADPSRLERDERAQWGSYYDRLPRVQFGDICEGFAALAVANQINGGSAWK